MNDFSGEDLNSNNAKSKVPQAKSHRWNVGVNDILDDTLSQELGQDTDGSFAPSANPMYRPARVRSATQDETTPATESQTEKLDTFIQSLDEKMAEADKKAGGSSATPATPQPATFSWSSLATLVALISAGWLLFVHYLRAGDAKNKIAQPAAQIDLPMNGSLVSLTAVEPLWRFRTDNDKTKAETKILPTLTLETSGTATGSGWLRVLFHDDVGEVRGDVTLVEVKNGRFVAGTSTQAQVTADGKKATFSASDGFTSEMTFTGYRQGISSRWSAKIEESTDAKRAEWKSLGYFEIGQDLQAQPSQ